MVTSPPPSLLSEEYLVPLEAMIGEGGSKLRLLGQIHPTSISVMAAVQGMVSVSPCKLSENIKMILLCNMKLIGTPYYTGYKVLLGRKHTWGSCASCLWLLVFCSSGLDSCSRDHVACKAWVTSLWSILFIILPPRSSCEERVLKASLGFGAWVLFF